MTAWLEALKAWNAKKGGSWRIPKKGSKEYEQVRKMMGKRGGRVGPPPPHQPPPPQQQQQQPRPRPRQQQPQEPFYFPWFRQGLTPNEIRQRIREHLEQGPGVMEVNDANVNMLYGMFQDVWLQHQMEQMNMNGRGKKRGGKDVAQQEQKQKEKDRAEHQLVADELWGATRQHLEQEMARDAQARNMGMDPSRPLRPQIVRDRQLMTNLSKNRNMLRRMTAHEQKRQFGQGKKRGGMMEPGEEEGEFPVPNLHLAPVNAEDLFGFLLEPGMVKQEKINRILELERRHPEVRQHLRQWGHSDEEILYELVREMKQMRRDQEKAEKEAERKANVESILRRDPKEPGGPPRPKDARYWFARVFGRGKG
jgi:hypothetical protein